MTFRIENLDGSPLIDAVETVFTRDVIGFEKLKLEDQEFLGTKILLFGDDEGGYGIRNRQDGSTLYFCNKGGISVEPALEELQLPIDPKTGVLTLPSGAQVIPA